MNLEFTAQKVDDARTDSQAALATSKFIHRKILIRLLLGWLFLSIMIGGVALWLEINRFQQFIHALALKESATLSTEVTLQSETTRCICLPTFNKLGATAGKPTFPRC